MGKSIAREITTVIKKIIPYLNRLGYDTEEDLSFGEAVELESSRGFTDIEVVLAGKCAFVIEAKRDTSKLKEKDVEQALAYGRARSVPFVALTNGFEFRQAVRAGESMSTVVGKIMKEEAKDFDEKTAARLIERASQADIKDVDELVEIIRKETGIQRRPASVKEELEKAADVPYTKVAPLKFFEYTFRDDFAVRVPAELVTKGVIEVAREKEDTIIRVRKSGFTRFEIFGRPD